MGEGFIQRHGTGLLNCVLWDNGFGGMPSVSGCPIWMILWFSLELLSHTDIEVEEAESLD